MAKNRRKNVSYTKWVKWVPFLLLVNVLPFVVKMKKVYAQGFAVEWMPSVLEYTDVFGYYKMNLLHVCAGLAAIGLFSMGLQKGWKNLFIKKDKLIFGVLVAAVVSTLLSPYKPFVYTGYVERFMGLWTWFSHFIIFFYIRNLLETKKDLQIATRALMISALILGAIGTLQALGHDPFRMSFFKKIMATKEMVENNLLDEIQFTFSERRVYMTLYNPNNVGLIVAGLFPVSLYGLIYGKKIGDRILGGVSGILLPLGLFGSESRAGFLSLGIGFFVFFLLNTFTFLRKYKQKRAVGALTVAFVIFGVAVLSFGISKFLNRMWLSADTYSGVSDMQVEMNNLNMVYKGQEVQFSYDPNHPENLCEVLGEDGKIYDAHQQENAYFAFESPELSGLTYGYGKMEDIVYMEIRTQGLRIPLAMGEEGFLYINQYGQMIEPTESETIGFENYYKVGSNRGYIWSRTLPLLKNSLIIGTGPDSFVFRFPQTDYLERAILYEQTNLLVDKPHNQYFNWWIEIGFFGMILTVAWIGAIVAKGKGHFFAIGLLGILISFLFYDISITTGWLFISLLGILDAPHSVLE